MIEKIAQTKTPAPEGAFGRASGRDAPNPALKFPSNKELELFLSFFQAQKERNELRGQEFPLDAWVDWTTNTIKLFVTKADSPFSKIFFEYWSSEAKKWGGN